MSIPRTWTGRVFIATSLDGYIAREDGDISWLTDPSADPGHAPATSSPNDPPDYEAFVAEIDHLVLGRGTYEKVLSFDPWPYEAFSVIVLSTTLPVAGDPRIVVARSVDQVLDLLESGGAGGVYVDGGQVISAFLERDLIDELTISVAPVILGGGLPLLGRLGRAMSLTHLGTSSREGMTSSRYAVVRS